MPPEARVYIIDDNEIIRHVIRRSATKHGHTIVGEACTRQEAADAISHFTEQNVQVVTLDANLTERDGSGKDGRILLAEIRSKAETVTVIGLTSNSEFPGVDLFVNKKDTHSVLDIGQQITDL